MRRDERGFTIVELLVTMLISSLLVGVMLQATVTGVRTIDTTNHRIAGSNDTQLVASFFAADVASTSEISIGGTTQHALPPVAASEGETLIGLWAAGSATTLELPTADMAQGWNVSSSTLAVGMADAPIPEDGPTPEYAAQSANGTNSVTHAIALARALLSTIQRQGVSSGSHAGTQQMTLTPPSGAQAGDFLLLHLAVGGGTQVNVVEQNEWELLDVRDASDAVKSLVYRRPAGGSFPPGGWTWTFESAGDGAPTTRPVAWGMSAYGGVSATAPAVATDVSPCGGEKSVLQLSWTDTGGDGANEVTYNLGRSTDGTVLERRHCLHGSGTPAKKQVLARNLASAASATAACVSAATTPPGPTTTTSAPTGLCDGLPRPLAVTLTIREPATPFGESSRIYQLRGSTRTGG